MSVAKIIEIISKSKIGFDDAVKQGIARAADTVKTWPPRRSRTRA